VVERREGESFVGDLSVHEYLNQGKQESDEPVEDEPVTEPADS